MGVCGKPLGANDARDDLLADERGVGDLRADDSGVGDLRADECGAGDLPAVESATGPLRFPGRADSTLRLPVASTSPTSTWNSTSVAGAFGAGAVAGGCFNHAVAIDDASIHLGGRRQNGHRKDCNRHGLHRQVCR